MHRSECLGFYHAPLLFFSCVFFFFNDTATTEIYTLSLHDALPISQGLSRRTLCHAPAAAGPLPDAGRPCRLSGARSEEHTSELQSPCNLVCRLLLEKKNITARRSNCCLSYPTDVDTAVFHHIRVYP